MYVTMLLYIGTFGQEHAVTLILRHRTASRGYFRASIISFIAHFFVKTLMILYDDGVIGTIIRTIALIIFGRL